MLMAQPECMQKPRRSGAPVGPMPVALWCVAKPNSVVSSSAGTPFQARRALFDEQAARGPVGRPPSGAGANGGGAPGRRRTA